MQVSLNNSLTEQKCHIQPLSHQYRIYTNGCLYLTTKLFYKVYECDIKYLPTRLQEVIALTSGSPPLKFISGTTHSDKT